MNCLRQLQLPCTGKMNFGGVKNETITKVINHIIRFLEENKEECQFFIDEILKDYKDEKPSDKWILKNLKEHYGEEMILTRLKNRSPVILFKDIGHEILHKAWYEKKEENMEKERWRLVKCEGKLF